jgi:hypothetical protein
VRWIQFPYDTTAELKQLLTGSNFYSTVKHTCGGEWDFSGDGPAVAEGPASFSAAWSSDGGVAVLLSSGDGRRSSSSTDGCGPARPSSPRTAAAPPTSPRAARILFLSYMVVWSAAEPSSPMRQRRRRENSSPPANPQFLPALSQNC